MDWFNQKENVEVQFSNGPSKTSQGFKKFHRRKYFLASLPQLRIDADNRSKSLGG